MPRTDYLVKRAEYADAGIAHYWIVDLIPDGSASLLACRTESTGDGYVDGGPVTNTYSTELPYPITVDLSRITDPLT